MFRKKQRYSHFSIFAPYKIWFLSKLIPHCTIIQNLGIMLALSLLRSVRSLVRLSKQPTERTSAGPIAADRDHTAESARTERPASRDPPYAARRCSNGSSNPSSCFRPSYDRCAAGAECYEGVRGANARRNDRPANASGNSSESRTRAGTNSARLQW